LVSRPASASKQEAAAGIFFGKILAMGLLFDMNQTVL
jgi:hypothetical protein